MKILGWIAAAWVTLFVVALGCLAKISKREMPLPPLSALDEQLSFGFRPGEDVEHIEEFGREEPVMAISSRRGDMPDARVIPFPAIPKEAPVYVSDEELLYTASLWDLDELKREIDQYDLAAAEYERRAERQRHIAEVLRGYVSSL